MLGIEWSMPREIVGTKNRKNRMLEWRGKIGMSR